MDSGHWNDVYRRKSEQEMSWFQELPVKSLELISQAGLAPGDALIDVGSGDSRLVDALLERGFRNLSVLDISSAALEKARARLGENARFVKFIVSDVREFEAPERYLLWHDRATFHFLTDIDDVERYLAVANRAIEPGGHLIVSTFSVKGPDKCSGLTVRRYSDFDLKSMFGKYFTNVGCIEDEHKTPWGAVQSFVYCGFRK